MRRTDQRLSCVIACIAFISCFGREAASRACEYGSLPGHNFAREESGFSWTLYDNKCQIQTLLPDFGITWADQTNQTNRTGKSSSVEGASILAFGDSIERNTLLDLANAVPNFRMSEWNDGDYNMAGMSPNLEMVFKFLPGSHPTGPWHLHYPREGSLVNAVPEGFKIHRMLTGRQKPNIVVLSTLLWELQRWIEWFPAGLTGPPAELPGSYLRAGPKLAKTEFLAPDMLQEAYNNTHIAMQWVEKFAGPDTLLIYHNAAFPKISHDTQHQQLTLGRREFLVQLNALSREVVRERPRWHLVDFGLMSEAYLDGSHIRDRHHPVPKFLLGVVDIYLNLLTDSGYALPPKTLDIGNTTVWIDYQERHGQEDREAFEQEYAEEKRRWEESRK